MEVAFDVMNAIRSTGARLITAELIDNDQRTQLPIVAFDGDDTLFSIEIQQLECEWKQLLSQSINE